METEEIVCIKYIDEFFRKLRSSESELSSEEIGKFLLLVNDNIPYSQNVVDRMLIYYKNNLFTEINNFNNFNHLSGLLTTILFNIDRKKDYLDINFAIIYIAEKTFYRNKDNLNNKIYLCSLLAKNKIFSEKKFWSELIELKISSVVEQKVSIEIKRRENEYAAALLKIKQNSQISQENESKEDENKNNSNKTTSNIKFSLNNDNILDLSTSRGTDSLNSSRSNSGSTRKESSGTNSIMNILGSKVKNFFSTNNNNKSLNKNNLILSNNNNLEVLNINKNQIIENITKNEASNVIKEFLNHFCNFNFDVSEANDLIVEFSIKYSYEQEKVMLFISMLNSNMFTIKNKNVKIPFIDYRDSNSEKNFKKFLKLNDTKLTVFASSLEYMDHLDLSNLILINSDYKKRLSKIIYSNILLNNNYHNNINYSSNKNNNSKILRLGLWRSCLNIV